ncbi:MAG: hypothetical protein ACPL1B_10230 [Thermoprotei archaeon]
MKIKVRTIFKNLAILLLLILPCLFSIIIPLIFLRLPWEAWIWGAYNEKGEREFILWRETILYEIFNATLPIIAISLLFISFKVKKTTMRNISLLILTITNIYYLCSSYWLPFGIPLGELSYVPLFAFLLLTISSLLYLTERL